MISRLQRRGVARWHRFAGPALPLCFLFVHGSANAQSPSPEPNATYSASGQFIVSGTPEFSPLLHQPGLAANPELVRLEPALLAVSAEHFKISLWHQLGLDRGTPWRGKIFLALHPAQTPDDAVNIAASPFLKAWNYRVELPDVLPRTRYAHTLAAVLLLEIANRDDGDTGHATEIPPWLANGLAQQALASDGATLILSTPAGNMNGLPQSRLDRTGQGLDPLAPVRRTLQNFSALTFDQLSWPTDAQVNGDDGGAYLASAQLFVHELLGLENGPARLRALLAQLPGCLNWQTAFYSAFRDDFQRPLDVEKWWGLRVVAFAARDPGPRWTPDASRDRLAEILSVPVEFRNDSNSLPQPAEISLQSSLRNFDPAQREAVLQTKLRDLELARLRLAPPFAALADAYRSVLADFLGGSRNYPVTPFGNNRGSAPRRSPGIEGTLEKLDELDARQREVEARVPADLLPQILNRPAP